MMFLLRLSFFQSIHTLWDKIVNIIWPIMLVLLVSKREQYNLALLYFVLRIGNVEFFEINVENISKTEFQISSQSGK